MSGEQIPLCEGFTLDLGRGCLLRGGEDVHLRPQSYEVLRFLAEHRGRLVTKDRLIEAVWEGRAVTDNSLSKCVEEVREALGTDARRHLRNVRGRGYIFDPPAGQPSEQANVSKLAGDEAPTAALTAATPPVSPADAAAWRSGAAIGRSVLARLAARRVALALAAAGLLATCLAAAAYYTGRPGNAIGVRTLAVLPFKPLVADAGDEALQVGMADTLIARLSNMDEVMVRPLSAVRRFGGLEQDPLEAGRRLGVEAVLDGTVQRSGDRVGVTVRLVRVGDGRQLWEGRFDAPFTDIFAVQDAISGKVAGSLKSRLTSAEATRLAKHYTDNVDAYQLYLSGRYHALKRTLPDTRRAVSYFERALTLDPSYALAYAGLADAHLSLLAADLPADAFLPKAREAAEKAVFPDETLAEAHAVLGFVIFWWDWHWEAAEEKLERALALDSNSASAHLFYAHLLSNTGRHGEALAEAKRATELDPLNPRAGALAAQFLIHAGRTDEALRRLQEILAVEPNYFLARLYAASAYIEKGMYSEAVGEARAARELSGAGNTYAEAFLAYALAKSGRNAEAREVLKGLLDSSAERYVEPYHVAIVYNGLGERDAALAWLERAYTQRNPGMLFLKVEPKWKDLRSDPHFQDLLRRIGFTP